MTNLLLFHEIFLEYTVALKLLCLEYNSLATALQQPDLADYGLPAIPDSSHPSRAPRLLHLENEMTLTIPTYNSRKPQDHCDDSIAHILRHNTRGTRPERLVISTMQLA